MNPLQCGHCLWWFVMGVLAGWLLNWLLSRWLSRARPADAPALQHAEASSAHATRLRGNGAKSAQATAAAQFEAVDIAAAQLAGFQLRHADDLTIIEGIDGSVDQLLRSRRVETFVDLALLGVDEIRRLLDQGGPPLRSINPASWAQQAALAAQNRWEELKILQARLNTRAAPADRE